MATKEQTVKVINDHGPMGWIVFIAWVGAVVYFYQQDPGFVGFFVAVVKGAFWPGFVIYEVLGLLRV